MLCACSVCFSGGQGAGEGSLVFSPPPWLESDVFRDGRQVSAVDEALALSPEVLWKEGEGSMGGPQGPGSQGHGQERSGCGAQREAGVQKGLSPDLIQGLAC